MKLRDAQEQIARLQDQGCYGPMEDAAKKYGLDLGFVCAIASRETNCDNILGDFRGGVYHGTGVMQIDIQHEIARLAQAHRTWKSDPDLLIAYGCAMLAADLSECIRRYPDIADDWARLKFTAASYNAGFGGAARGHAAGDVDEWTTGKNYGADTMDRMRWFDSALIIGPRPKRTVVTK